MARTRTAAQTSRKLSRRQVIDRIMEVVEKLPDVVKDLPDHLKNRKHWEQTFSPSNSRASNVLKVLSELPAFTNHAPKKSSTQNWKKVFARHMGLEQLPQTLREIHAIANQKSAKRKP